MQNLYPGYGRIALLIIFFRFWHNFHFTLEAREFSLTTYPTDEARTSCITWLTLTVKEMLADGAGISAIFITLFLAI